ncbi:unnamed protein product [Prorocentrum cordatum]|uniref:Uncharacterized protein n=1 Tax=Prorocentrum cordatum TaxID=2364126 RepID=A0ABN9XMW1_9DINO|nr:unnamed protein product [Polarella glacialis]
MASRVRPIFPSLSWTLPREYAIRVLWANTTDDSVASLDEVLADEVDAEFELLRSAVHLQASLVHPSVAQRAARVSGLLSAIQGAMTALVVQICEVLFSVLVWQDAPYGRAAEERWTARLAHLVGLAACHAAAAACAGEASRPPVWALDVLWLALNFWANVWALAEHSAWGLGFWDVQLLAYGGFCPPSRFVAEAFLGAGRGGGEGALVRPALRAASWFPAPHDLFASSAC